jgi:hypothetical protein
VPLFDLCQRAAFGWADNLVMKKPREEPDAEERSLKPTRLARRLVERDWLYYLSLASL